MCTRAHTTAAAAPIVTVTTAAAAPTPAIVAAAAAAGDSVVRPYVMSGRLREGEQPQSLADMLPDWVGYGTLYGISVIPVVIVVSVVLVLFYNSLK